MQQAQTTIHIETSGQGLFEITSDVAGWLKQSGIKTGLLTVFCRHTSASLTIQENADPDVALDLNDFFKKLVAEDANLYRHTNEGIDDMPAHIKSSLTDVSLSIPVAGGKAVLGTWQGIYLFEHRARPNRREVVLHLTGE